MSLTYMQALFGSDPKCKFNSSREGQDRVLFWQAFQKRVRAEFAGTMITDRRRVQALHETGHMAVKLGVIDHGRVLGAPVGAGLVAGGGPAAFNGVAPEPPQAPARLPSRPASGQASP